MTVRDPGTFVVAAHVMDDMAERKLEGYLRELEQKNRHAGQGSDRPDDRRRGFLRLSFNGTPNCGSSGRAGLDNGVLVGMALQEREVRNSRRVWSGSRAARFLVRHGVATCSRPTSSGGITRAGCSRERSWRRIRSRNRRIPR